ncbi:MAG: isoaspartyl peptidase/L-asparaginase family protein [Janthinobacterium lividum]
MKQADMRQAPAGNPAVIVIHGGAGTLLRAAMSDTAEAEYRAALQAVLEAGQAILAGGGSALDAVTEAVRLLEECPLFNAGRGAVLNEDGTHELDAAIMDGASRAAGAVAGVTRLRNPVLCARAVLRQGEHVLLAGAGAERFAEAQGCETVSNDFFGTDARRVQWQKARAASAGMLLDHDAQTLAATGPADGTAASDATDATDAVIGRAGVRNADPIDSAPTDLAPIDPDRKFGTVGAVACDVHGHVAAATSTGGMTNKRVGRIGDSPLIGAGCYADDATCAVSATGSGEHFIRIVAAHALAARIEYTGAPLDDAARDVIDGKLTAIGGRGGLIAVDARGRIAMPFNTEGMYRGHARVGERPVTAIYRDES